ncbi:UNVERIFIED_CONTAM: cytochrome [Sesamum radiatum]|uniref:Cytochrome n=1 Tax=Sesamum radiatum TaxID=300843 RepID=A0AAW2PKQ8_SESRA
MKLKIPSSVRNGRKPDGGIPVCPQSTEKGTSCLNVRCNSFLSNRIKELAKTRRSSFQVDEFLMHPFLLYLLGLISLYFFAKWLHKPRRKLPASPPKLPILGNLHQLSALTHRSLQSLGRKYGPLMLLHFSSRPVIIVQSADAATEIMKTNDLIFADKPATRTTRRLFYDMKDISVAPYGEYWRKLKSVCVLQLLSSKRVQSFNFIREEETELLVKRIKSHHCPSLSPVNLSELFTSLTNDVICRAAFGRKYSDGEDGKKFLMLLTKGLQLVGSISIGDFIPCLSWINRVNGFDNRVDKVAEEVDAFLEMVIQEHLNEELQSCGAADPDQDERRENFVDILLNIYKDNNTGVSIDKDSIKAIILDILAGGTDTTSATLEWAMTELLRHPMALKNLQNELRGILKDKQDITENVLSKMNYLKAVVKETLRLHPPITFRSCVLDEPEKFKPERFLTCSIDFKGLDFQFIPFGAGRRGCPGTAFAMASVELVLANLVQKFEWELPKGMKSEDLDFEEQPGVTIHRKNPLFAVATHCYF